MKMSISVFKCIPCFHPGWHRIDVREREGGQQCCAMESESIICDLWLFLKYWMPVSPRDCSQHAYSASGTRVYRHCTAWTSTSCAPCIDFTFNDQPNGLEQCSPCTVCVKGLGVKTVRACTPSSDTVCGVLEGHYCINPYKGGCRAANKHTACRPGQFIKQPGTEYTDTVCEDCSDHSYSDGSFTSCKPHTDCESRGLVTVKAGDQAADSECGEKSNTALTVMIAATIIIIIIIIIIAVTAVSYRRRKKFPEHGKNITYLSAYQDL
uniref:TNFR-Cys domain-containing protein n=1 Tax=Paramormyrops kingsleyae TaxID=1676925 RepID=A0A3B3SXF8_9TELE